VLEAANLSCSRGGKQLFHGLSFALQPGERVRIAGANGSGKTSLLRILCGLLEPGAGEVRWQGEKIGFLKEEYSRSLVYLGHAPAVKDDLTAAENLAVTCALAGLKVSSSEIEQALRRFSLPDNGVPVRKLSQGQRRRAALARLALSEAVPLWLLDEPYAALDTAAAKLLEALVDAHAARGGAVVFTTHQDSGIGAARVIQLDA
jgi:heme exporter protein A